MKKWKT